ncbi:SCO family protein [soil metagenome]
MALRSLAACAAGLLFVGTTACTNPEPEARTPTSTASFSVYDLGSTWHDQSGATRSLSDLRGRPWVVAMIYTRCTSTCPLVIGELQRLEAATDSSLGLLLVSLDPVVDTPEILAPYAREHGMTGPRWTLLSGSASDVRDLAATLGIRYRRLTPDDIAHSNLLTLLDAQGHVTRQHTGLADEGLIAAAKSLSLAKRTR